jgi:transglutaminase-like putative cysteine protease
VTATLSRSPDADRGPGGADDRGLRPDRGSGDPWVTALGTGLAVLLAGAPVSAVVQGAAWIGYAGAAVGAVVATGLLLARAGGVAVACGQLLAALALLTALFTDDGALGVLPGPGALREMAAVLAGAGDQVAAGIAPVPATPEILFLVTAAFGLLAVAAYLAAVTAGAPAAAGVPLLTAFAVPTALAEELLPWWAMAAAATGLGVLLLVGPGARRRLTGGVALTAGAIALALVVGAGAGLIGTAGRFGSGAGAGGAGGAIGLNPFTALRGQLDQSTPVELFRVRGLPQPAYLRALTLRDYVPEAGWQAERPAPGVVLPAELSAAGPAAEALVEIENVGFRDYWLPLYATPLSVTGVTGDRWAYDRSSGTAYTSRPRAEEAWQQRVLLDAPTAAQLRDAEGSGVAPGYLDTEGVDERVAALAAEVSAGSGSDFDRAVALLDFFTGPNSTFAYSLATAPGSGDDALVEFLTVGRTGYCEQFASAMAVMLRTVGVPARVAVGFTAGTDTGDHRSVGTADAHAWVEAWFPGVGWTIFDPTPLTDGRTLVPPYVEEARAEAAAGADGAAPEQPAADDLPVPDSAAPQQAPDEIAPGVGESGADPDAGIPLWPAAVLTGLLLVAAVPAAVRGLDRRRRLAAVAAGGPGAAGAGWAELLAESADRGVPAPASDTVRGAARRLVREHRLDPDAQQHLRHVVTAVEASWYGGAGVPPGRERPSSELGDAVRSVLAGIAGGSPLGLRGRLLPRSVLARLPRRRRSAEPSTVNTARAT